MSVLLGLWAAALLGCGPADPADEVSLGEDQAQIVNGTTDHGDPAVVALTVWGQMFCTGTLITPNVVLTAAHCLPPNIQGIASSYSEIHVFFGTEVGDGTFIDVVDGWTHPAWHDQATEDDIGLIHLSQGGPATPIVHNTQSISGDEGRTARIIGFGQTSESNPGSAGTKRETTSTIADVYARVFEMYFNPGGTCSGDSGGPVLLDKGGQEKVVGVTSRSDCQYYALKTRVDAYEYEINNFLSTVVEPTCDADGECAYNCPQPDPDCPCAQDGHCTTQCADWPNDPDCNPNCVANNLCIAEGCPVPDPDCLGCEADGTCNTTCANDPDCLECPADGVCDRNCSADPDCWVAGGTENIKYDGAKLSSGCSTSARTAQGSVLGLGWLLWAMGLAAAGVGHRRRARRS